MINSTLPRVEVADLMRDPYPIFARLQQQEPISWIESLGLWYVTRYEDVRAILADVDNFTTAFEDSLIFDTFGAQMLTTEGADHDRYRGVVQPAFTPGAVRRRFEAGIHTATAQLLAGFAGRNEVELRSAFAGRLPILTMLSIFGLPADGEARMRQWYDAFEGALANFTRDPVVRSRAQAAVGEFHDYLGAALARESERGARSEQTSLLTALVMPAAATALSDEEIKRNMSIILFGGISTVEALILNSLWALFEYPDVMRRVCADLTLVPKVVDETLRWMSPVQSATRHVVHDIEFKGVRFRQGEVVNCMLGAANRDPAVFQNPAAFDIDRGNVHRHLAFASGPHSCLGFQLAKTEARIALHALLNELPHLRRLAGRSSAPEGYEFRQPRRLQVAWGTP